jgi:16S rRNA processing protein RimM
MDQDRVVIAEILRSRGNRGELLAMSQTDVPGRIEALKSATARLADGSDVSVEIAAAWRHGDCWVLKFVGVDSINDAERFRGADLWVAPANRGTLPEGDFFQSDLIGCSVIDPDGKQLGEVKGWHQYGGPPLMKVAVDGREVLIPFVSQLCDTDLSKRTIQVDLPEGLLDL